MRINYILPVIILAGATLASCSMQPEKSSTLDDARIGYSAAQSNPDVTNLAAVELQQAGKALDKANEAQSKREDQDVVDHLAYLAKKQVAIAQETAKLKAAELSIANASADRDKIRLEVRTAEADAARQRMANVQEIAMANAGALAVANADIESGNARLEAQRVEADAAARQQALDAQESSDQKTAELAAANARVSEMEKELDDLNAKKTERGMVITLGDMLFDTNMADIKSEVANGMQGLAEFFNEYPERKARIEGFTDSTGSSSYNMDLSLRRANAVRNTLMGMGVSGDRVSAHGYGEENPVASNETIAGRQLNRRVEIIISEGNDTIATR